MLCPNCGKETKKELCPNCFLELNPIQIKKIEIHLCQCGRFLYRGKWRKNFDNFLKNIVKENLILSRKIKLEKIWILSKEREGENFSLRLGIEGKYHSEKISQKINSEIKIKKRLCNGCKIGAQYYEAIVQFRGFKPDFEVDPRLVSQIKKSRGGLDFYFTRKGYAKKIAREFRKKGFQVKESETLFGITEHGKRKSRLTISIKSLQK